MAQQILGAVLVWLALSSMAMPAQGILITLSRIVGRLAQGGGGGSGGGDLDTSSLRYECRSSARSLFFNCGQQYRYLYYVFGSLYAPLGASEDEVIRALSRMPQPSYSCCRAAYEFHSNLCACDPATISAFRSSGLFDPEVTQVPAQYIYGTRCGGPVTTGDQCPNGNPFDILRG